MLKQWDEQSLVVVTWSYEANGRKYTSAFKFTPAERERTTTEELQARAAAEFTAWSDGLDAKMIEQPSPEVLTAEFAFIRDRQQQIVTQISEITDKSPDAIWDELNG